MGGVISMLLTHVGGAAVCSEIRLSSVTVFDVERFGDAGACRRYFTSFVDEDGGTDRCPEQS